MLHSINRNIHMDIEKVLNEMVTKLRKIDIIL